MNAVDQLLDGIVPASEWHADWKDVVERAGVRMARPTVHRRRRWAALAAAALIVVLAPLVAVAASQGWWVLRSGAGPQPTSAPVLVKQGSWSGHGWELVAYPSGTDGLCFSVIPAGSEQTGLGAGAACAPFAGVQRTAETKPSPDMTITWMSGSQPNLPPYIAGPVVANATAVKIHLTSGQTLETDTFPAPAPLERVRFYAMQLAEPLGLGRLPSGGKQLSLAWLAGFDADGRMVACLAPATAEDGISPLSACR